MEGGERNTICKSEKDHQGKIVTSLVVTGTWVERSVRQMGGLGKPRKAHMYTVHIRVERRNPRKAKTKKTPSQRVSLLRFARLKQKHVSEGNSKKGTRNRGSVESTYSLNESYKNL